MRQRRDVSGCPAATMQQAPRLRRVPGLWPRRGQRRPDRGSAAPLGLRRQTAKPLANVASPRGRPLDPRQHHRRHPGRGRPRPVRGHLHLSGARGGGRRTDPDAGRHPPHRLPTRCGCRTATGPGHRSRSCSTCTASRCTTTSTGAAPAPPSGPSTSRWAMCSTRRSSPPWGAVRTVVPGQGLRRHVGGVGRRPGQVPGGRSGPHPRVRLLDGGLRHLPAGHPHARQLRLRGERGRPTDQRHLDRAGPAVGQPVLHLPAAREHPPRAVLDHPRSARRARAGGRRRPTGGAPRRAGPRAPLRPSPGRRPHNLHGEGQLGP